MEESSSKRARLDSFGSKTYHCAREVRGDERVEGGGAKAATTTATSFDTDLQCILRGVHGDVRRFFGHLNRFYQTKKEFAALCDREVVPAGVFDTLNDKVRAVGIQDEATGDYNLGHFQRQKDGKRPIKCADELYETAELVLPRFERLLRDIAAEFGTEVEVKLSPSGLKARSRAEQKAQDDYSGRQCDGNGPAIGWVYDIVRGSFICNRAGTIKSVIERIVKDERVNVVLKFKNKFKNRAASGFCYMLLQVVLSVDSLVHVCEIQVHLRAVAELNERTNTHDAYAYFRKFYHDSSMDAVEERLKELEIVVGPDFVATEDDDSAPTVLEQLAGDVAASSDVERMYTFALLCKDFLEIFDLAVYIMKATINVATGDETKRKTNKIVAWLDNDIGEVYTLQSKFVDAMKHFDRSLAAKIEYAGKDHEDVGYTYSNMATCMRDKRAYEEASTYYEKALGILQEALGMNDPAVLKAQSSLAKLRRKQGRYDDAMDLYKQVRKVQESTSRKGDAVDIADTLGGMAKVLRRQGNLTEAMECHREALILQLNALGSSHRSVAWTYNNMATVFRMQSDYVTALEHAEKALKIRVKIMGVDHYLVGWVEHNIGSILRKQGKLEKALAHCENALRIQQQTYGKEHVVCSVILNKIADIHRDSEKYLEAEEYYNRSIALQESKLGTSHADVAWTHNKIGVLRAMQGRYDDALECHRRALPIFKEAGCRPGDVRWTHSKIAAAEGIIKRGRAMNACA